MPSLHHCEGMTVPLFPEELTLDDLVTDPTLEEI